MPQHHGRTQKRKLSIVKNTTTQNKMQGKAAMIGLLRSGSLNAKRQLQHDQKVEKLYLDFSLTIHYNEYINSFFLLPIRQSVSSLAAERLCFRSFSIFLSNRSIADFSAMLAYPYLHTTQNCTHYAKASGDDFLMPFCLQGQLSQGE